MFDRYPPIEPSAREFEEEVKKMIDAMGVKLIDYHSTHREKVDGADGEYEIDITVRFSALGVNYLTLVECKRHRSRVKREDIHALWTKMQSTGAHKGIVFATSGFQSGALEFASAHGIALVAVADGRSSYVTRSADQAGEIPWERVPSEISRVVGWIQNGSTVSLVSDGYGSALAKALAFET